MRNRSIGEGRMCRDLDEWAGRGERRTLPSSGTDIVGSQSIQPRRSIVLLASQSNIHQTPRSSRAGEKHHRRLNPRRCQPTPKPSEVHDVVRAVNPSPIPNNHPGGRSGICEWQISVLQRLLAYPTGQTPIDSVCRERKRHTLPRHRAGRARPTQAPAWVESTAARRIKSRSSTRTRDRCPQVHRGANDDTQAQRISRVDDTYTGRCAT